MPSVYIETSIVSYLAARPSKDVNAAAWQHATATWWKNERPRFELFISELVSVEISGGDAGAAARRAAIVESIDELAINDSVRLLAKKLIAERGIPAEARADALHISVAAVHTMDYLLTWNCRHINNATAKPLIREICASAGYTCPEICTPYELLTE